MEKEGRGSARNRKTGLRRSWETAKTLDNGNAWNPTGRALRARRKPFVAHETKGRGFGEGGNSFPHMGRRGNPATSPIRFPKYLFCKVPKKTYHTEHRKADFQRIRKFPLTFLHLLVYLMQTKLRMKIVNCITYPILNYLDQPVPWLHRSFSRIFDFADKKEILSQIPYRPELLDEIGNFNGFPEALRLADKPTAKRVSGWPLFAFDPEDFRTMGESRFLALLKIITLVWQTVIFQEEATAEVVTASTLNDAMDFDPEGFDEWFDRKRAESYSVSGLLLIPETGMAEIFRFDYAPGTDDENSTETTVALAGTTTAWIQTNYQGFASHNLNIGSDPLYRELAAERGWTLEETFFENDTFAILKYVYYKEKLGLRPRAIGKGETIRAGERTDSWFRVITDAPCVIYEKPIQS